MKKTLMTYGSAMLGAGVMVTALLIAAAPHADTYVGGVGTDSMVMADDQPATMQTATASRFDVEPAAGPDSFRQDNDDIQPMGNNIAATSTAPTSHNTYHNDYGNRRSGM